MSLVCGGSLVEISTVKFTSNGLGIISGVDFASIQSNEWVLRGFVVPINTTIDKRSLEIGLNTD